MKGIDFRQLVSYCAFGCFYFISVPVALYLGVFADWGLKGIWIGYGSAVCVLSIILGIKLIFFTSLEERSVAIRKRLAEDKLGMQGADKSPEDDDFTPRQDDVIDYRTISRITTP